MFEIAMKLINQIINGILIVTWHFIYLLLTVQVLCQEVNLDVIFLPSGTYLVMWFCEHLSYLWPKLYVSCDVKVRVGMSLLNGIYLKWYASFGMNIGVVSLLSNMYHVMWTMELLSPC